MNNTLTLTKKEFITMLGANKNYLYIDNLTFNNNYVKESCIKNLIKEVKNIIIRIHKKHITILFKNCNNITIFSRTFSSLEEDF